ncbi:F-box DNA helicase 1-like [Octopus vulgaris]|uniref:F-box DNA helicase 1-like n=1 Tax=Octopus vulgaris TaxID=6645 RepID=A0AA36AWT6_OCTVU|nr:F-box DNA helicase 1-like [Octopus vulgaris]
MSRLGLRKARNRTYLSESSPSTSNHTLPTETAGQCLGPNNNNNQKRGCTDMNDGLDPNVSQSNSAFTGNRESKLTDKFTGFTKASQLIGLNAPRPQNIEKSKDPLVKDVTIAHANPISETKQTANPISETKQTANPISETKQTVSTNHAFKICNSYSGKSKILMTTSQCFDYQNTEEGSKALVNPFSVLSKAGNINKFLQPRKQTRKKKNHQIENQSSLLQFYSSSPKKTVVPRENPNPSQVPPSDPSVNDDSKRIGSSHPVATTVKKSSEDRRSTNVRKRKRPPYRIQSAAIVLSDSDDGEGNNNNTSSACNFAEKHYGLFGDSCDDILEKVNFFDRLPEELKRIIFCQLPARDLFYTCPQVCTDWNRVINKTKFMPSKLLYYKVRKNAKRNQQNKFRQQLHKNGFTDPVSFLPHFIRYMKQHSCYQNFLPCLYQHPCYEKALFLMKTQFQDCMVDKKPNPWSMVTLMCILCATVNECHLLVKSLLCSDYGALDILLDNVYSIALHLYGMTCIAANKLWNAVHYRLFYSLYLYENSSCVTVAQMSKNTSVGEKQQTIVRYCDGKNKLRLTNEQLQIVNHNVKPGEIINIIAFAGTGKSSTLVRYTQMRPGVKFLLIVYNKSVCEHAKTVFPPNVHCMTGHGLAFKKRGIKYAINQKLHPGTPKVRDVESALPCVNNKSHTLRARMVLFILEKFLTSKDPKITNEHISDFMNTTTYIETFQGNVDPEECLKDAQQYWDKMIDIDETTVKMTHDGYLKLFQLSRPKLGSYDVILVDEAQDLTPAIADILLSQPQAKILVGDPNQQIYAFRGAINAMQSIEANQIFYLTQSFRFGPEIAFAANCFLQRSCRCKEILVGGTNKSTIKGETIGQLAYIARCNFTLFSEAVQLGYNKKPRIKMAFVGGTTGFGFNVLRDIHSLLVGERPVKASQNKPSFVARFSSFHALKRYAEHSCDYELLGQIQIAQTYAIHLPKILDFFQESEIKEVRDAEIVFTTAHKSKGLEFDTVKILDDFNLDTQDERNLFYVAITRAKYSLYLTDYLCHLIDEFSGSRLQVVMSDGLETCGKSLVCGMCGSVVKQKRKKTDIFLSRETVNTMSHTYEGGIICKQCASLPP